MDKAFDVKSGVIVVIPRLINRVSFRITQE